MTVGVERDPIDDDGVAYLTANEEREQLSRDSIHVRNDDSEAKETKELVIERNQGGEEEQGEGEEDETATFPADVFTTMFFADPMSWPFLYSIFVFFMQMTILLVFFFDLINFQDRHDEDNKGNLLNLPQEVDTQVRVAQVIATLIAAVSNTDVTCSLEMLSVGWRPYFKDHFHAATRTKFVVSNLLRITEGVSVIGVSFILIVQPDNVLDIFLNFAAVQFVAGLDDIAYQIAREGWLGRYMKHFNISTEVVRLPSEMDNDWVLVVKPILVLGLLGLLYATLSAISAYQALGPPLPNPNWCAIVEVKFGDHVLPLEENDNVRFVTYNESANDGNGSNRKIEGSDRVLGIEFNTSQLPDLHYAYFSGIYYIDEEHLIAGRPRYYENDDEDITSGMFYYCEHEKAWVFTIRALKQAGALPNYTNTKCDHGWLLRSARTDALSVDEAPDVGWKVWTGVLDTTSDVSVICAECNNDFDCGLEHGKCVDNRCECSPGIAEGDFCQEEAACQDVVVFDQGEPGVQGKRLPDESSPRGTFRNIRTAVLGNVSIYGKPAYYLPIETSNTEDLLYQVILYTGRRWYEVYFFPVDFPLEAEDTEEKKDFFRQFHAYWNNVQLSNVRSVSELTDNHLPTGQMKWYLLDSPMSMGNYGSFPATLPYAQRYECYSVNCDVHSVCGPGGNCTERDLIMEDDGYELKGNGCICSPNTYGHFCEFACDQTTCGVLSSESPSQTPVSMPSNSPSHRPAKMSSKPSSLLQ